ncbi:MAG: ribonucleoside triphosphate reductase [Candidatus Diapherotrites archaeon]|nr:ribonucleoside triphosphate reductase [Candidatus Diapherotrites archaeon]
MEKFLSKVKKRDGRIVPFQKEKIEEAIWKAAKAVGGEDRKLASKLADKVVHELKKKFGTKIPTVEEIQDMVEKVLIEEGHAKTAKAYILYRAKRSAIRDTKAFLAKTANIIEEYMNQKDWRVRENSNAGYSLSGMQARISEAIISEYTLKHIYPAEISKAHKHASFHIHDLGVGTFAAYCAGWSLKQLLQEGFNGVEGKVAARPAKHFTAAVGQLVNFMGTLQNEWAGAQALSSFDTYLAPFVAKDKLDYKRVKQGMQEFVYSLNATSRWGNQVPFTNITLDWSVPKDLKDVPAVFGGKEISETYGEFQQEMDLINRAFIEVMIEGDMNGRIFTFPIPTYNITKDFDWNSENADLLFKMTSRYGIPYFQNFVNSSLKPSDVRSMCCRLQLDVRELRNKTGGLFGSGEKTGSIGVVTINMPQIAHLTKDEDKFIERLDYLMYLAKESLEIKRKEVEKNMKNGLLPWTKRYLGTLEFHFSTIGLIGMNEACLNLFGKSIANKDSKKFALKVLDFMRSRLQDFQEETGNIYNLEATPGEGASYRLARIDVKNYPDIITAGTKEAPYYTNSTHLPVGYTDDIFEALDHQDELQCKYTGGTVLHGFIGEEMPDSEACKKLVRAIAHNYKLPYFTITPTFSVCPVHGYIAGKHYTCPADIDGGQPTKCGKRAEVYSRVVGYYRPVQNWNTGKQREFEERKPYDVIKALEKTK